MPSYASCKTSGFLSFFSAEYMASFVAQKGFRFDLIMYKVFFLHDARFRGVNFSFYAM